MNPLGRIMKHKIVMIGDSMVGKTSLMNRLTRNVFLNSCPSTVGTGCGVWSTVVGEDPLHLQIWDTAGQERYRSLGGIFYQNSEAAIIVYSKSDPKSADNVRYWVSQFRSVMGTSPFIAIVQNKSDIDSEESASETDDEEIDISKWSKEKGFYYTEVSAKTGQNVEELFSTVAKSIIQKLEIPTTLILPPPTFLAVKEGTTAVKQCC